VFLKSLTLKGFKSFADTTTLEFEPGVTVVVGPNGSGKSNVVDAVAWVLGAQGPRTLRSSKMEDVIFAGAPKRPALGRAEVSLTIDNSAGLLPIDFSEVTITRTLFRNGESEYAINRVPCRLLDIQELLSDTGVGRQQHVIVSQGNLDAVLNARPEERRLVVEEAAGILKYRRRKEKAERRLDSTESSLVRLQDLLREVRRQLRPLEKQAEAARRHGDLVAELAAVRRYLLARDLSNVESRLAAAGRDRQEFSVLEEQVRSSLGGLDARIIETEAAVPDSGPDLGDLLSSAEGLRARAGGLVAVLAERRRSIERTHNAAADQDVIASLEAEAAALAEQLAGTEAEAARLLPEADALAEAERGLAEETEAVEAHWGSTPTAPADPSAEVRGELTALRSAVEQGGVELRRLDARVASLEDRVAKLDSEHDRLVAAVAAADQAAPALTDAETRAWAAAESADRERSEADAARRRADADYNRWAAREEALAQALDAARAQAGVERLSATGGVLGTVVDLVEVEEGYSAAFEAAASEVLDAVVLDGVESARRGLAELQRLQAGGALLPLPELGDEFSGRGEELPNGAVPLRGKVRGRLPGVDALLDRILARAAVVEGGWEAAIDLALQRPDLVVATTSGDRFSGGLWRTGASGPGATGAALEEARHHAQSASASAQAAALRLEEAEERSARSRDALLAATRAAEANQSRRRTAADTLARIETERAERAAELESTRSQRHELDARLARERTRVDELDALLPELQRLAAEEAENAAAERAARFRLAERASAVASMRRDLEVRAAGLDERRTLTATRLAEVEERLRRNVAERDQAASRRQAALAASSVTEALLGAVRRRELELEQIVAELREARRAEMEAQRERVSRLEQLRRERSAAEKQLAELRERLARVDLEETESRVRLEGITEQIRRDLDCEPDSVRGAECPELPAGTSAVSRRSELERELRLMGPINPLALEEHTALIERHQFLDAQLEDVRAARRELTKVIKAIDAEIIEVFGAAYADVAEHFEGLISTLFPGGEGRLRLTDPEHVLETGIEIEARPSGKNLRRLSLLSGGERSLVAMAFLFAVFRARPSPFYMLDEVEAALDDVNLHRFLDLVAEFREEAQLLIVSHQKRTMEAADCLYGVTMAPGGSSRVVSERVATQPGEPVRL
jgi:chromosome segregation protein